MNGAILLLIGITFFTLAYFIYGRYLRRLFGVDAERPTPAHSRRDGVDYVPTRLPVLFGHHFASIAGAGPIVGPVLAVYLGWAPVALWILLGAVFVGAMHDFAALFLSVRNEGRSIGHVIEKQLGYAGRQIFLLFSWAALILVVAIFAILVARTFVSTPAVATASLLFIAMAPVFGTIVHRKGVSIGVASLVFVPLLFFSIWLGTAFEFDLTRIFDLSPEYARNVWLVVLLAYVFVASTLPVWLLLQPRDYLNSYLLYAMVLVGLASILFVSPDFKMPAFVGWAAAKPKGGIGHLFPILYVTVACGACSGFHALVASGTTAKQLSSEKHAVPVGYGGMLVEGIVALMALISVAILTRTEYVDILADKSPVGAFASGLAGLAARIGLPEKTGETFIALAISAFLLTTLDTATRLARFSWQELFLPRSRAEKTQPREVAKVASNPFIATFVAVALSAYLAFSGNVWQIWPVFGAANQLLAALTLLIITLFLVRKKANFWIALIPMLFMVTITTWALVQLFAANWGTDYVLVGAVAFLLVTAMILAAMAVFSLLKARGEIAGEKSRGA